MVKIELMDAPENAPDLPVLGKWIDRDDNRLRIVETSYCASLERFQEPFSSCRKENGHVSGKREREEKRRREFGQGTVRRNPRQIFAERYGTGPVLGPHSEKNDFRPSCPSHDNMVVRPGAGAPSAHSIGIRSV